MGGDAQDYVPNAMQMISIHTTRVGGDSESVILTLSYVVFQSTPPVWVVTGKLDYKTLISAISIHTTRVGGDALQNLTLLI